MLIFDINMFKVKNFLTCLAKSYEADLLNYFISINFSIKLIYFKNKKNFYSYIFANSLKFFQIRKTYMRFEVKINFNL